MSKKEMGYRELERLINENFGDKIKAAAQAAAKAAADRGRHMRGAGSKYGTSGDPFRAAIAGFKGKESPQEDIFQGETEPGAFNKGLADIIAFYEKLANDIMPQAQSKWNQAIFKMKSTKRELVQMLGPEAASKESTKDFFKGSDSPSDYNRGLKEIISYYKKTVYDDPVKNLEKTKIVRFLKSLQRETESILRAQEDSKAQPETPQEPEQQQQEPEEQPQQQDSETDTEESEESEEESDNNTEGD